MTRRQRNIRSQIGKAEELTAAQQKKSEQQFPDNYKGKQHFKQLRQIHCTHKIGQAKISTRTYRILK